MFVYKIDKGVQEMDDGANPHLGIIGRIVKFLKEMWHRLPFVQKEDVTEEEIISMKAMSRACFWKAKPR